MLRFFIILLNCLLMSLLVNLTYANLSPKHIQQLKQQAKQGDADAQTELGNHAELRGDYKQAFHWFKQLTKQDKVDDKGGGLTNLGLMYMNGKGVTKNYKQAKCYFQKAINLGYKHTYGNMGLLYYNGGHGVKKDIKKAKHYYRLGIKYKSNEAMFNLANLYAHQNQYKQAFHWYHQAAKQYYLRGMYVVGILYAIGKQGVRQNKVEGCKWFRLALKVYPDYQKAHYMLGKLMPTMDYTQKYACHHAVKKYLKHHDVPRKSDFKARLELKS